MPPYASFKFAETINVMSDLRITTNSDEMDRSMIHAFLSKESYWARGATIEVVETAIENSLCFGGFVGSTQVAFARVVSDYSMFAYFRDMFVVEKYRGRGYGKALVQAVVSHPDLQELQSFMLGTDDAHGLYQQYGFITYPNPDRLMLLASHRET